MAGETLYDIPIQTLEGRPATLEPYRGDVLLIVNVASQCGFTPQYTGLEALEKKFAAQGFHVLGFPCNQFMGQEPGSADEIREFCSTQYDVTFPLFAKIEVNGGGTHPLYQYLKSHAKGLLGTEAIKWNFTKFLINRAGEVEARHAPQVTPESLESEIESLLAQPRPAS
jgi:glutathione peroxidase